MDSKKSGVLNDGGFSDMGVWVDREGDGFRDTRGLEERQRVQVRVRFQYVRYTNENVKKKSSC